MNRRFFFTAVTDDRRNTGCIPRESGTAVVEKIHSKPCKSLYEAAQATSFLCQFFVEILGGVFGNAVNDAPDHGIASNENSGEDQDGDQLGFEPTVHEIDDQIRNVIYPQSGCCGVATPHI